jgi:hypothetical protein
MVTPALVALIDLAALHNDRLLGMKGVQGAPLLNGRVCKRKQEGKKERKTVIVRPGLGACFEVPYQLQPVLAYAFRTLGHLIYSVNGTYLARTGTLESLTYITRASFLHWW